MEQSYNPLLKIACDTSFLLEAIRRRLITDLFERFRPLEIHVIKPVYRELDMLAKRLPEARVALKLIRSYEEFRLVDYGESLPSDAALLDYACREKLVLATTDRELRRKASERGCRTLFIRGSWLSFG